VPQYDAVVVGSGPNGLAAAITLAREGRSVLVLEANEGIGGGTHSAELTLPGFVHDVCSAIHPFVAASPFFRTLPLAEHGLELVEPPAAVAHPFDDGTAALLERPLSAMSRNLGTDGPAYRDLIEPFVRDWARLEDSLLGPVVSIPRHPVALGRFGLQALRSATRMARGAFETERARALFAGCAAHSMLPLEKPPSAAFGLVLLAVAHRVGWPFARGGAQAIADALASYLRSLGGDIETARRVESLREVPPARAVLLDVTPRQLLAIAGDRVPPRYRRALRRFRYGPGVFKLDYALDGPIPWRAPECARAATVHLGGTLAELEASERAPWNGEHSERPFVLLAQQTLFDGSRAPRGKHTAWAYCHVPNGSDVDMTDVIEAQIERFAPGFRARILARSALGPGDLARRNANLVGGDVNGGAFDFPQLVAGRSRARIRTQRRSRACTSARPRRRRAAGCTGCAGTSPPGRPCARASRRR
jgi:phytoene dehydrogenase-like protein